MRMLLTLVLLQVLLGGALARRKAVRRGAEQGCSFNLTKDMPKNEPVMMFQSGRSSYLALPSGDTGILKFKEGQKVVLACSGESNKMEKLPSYTSVSANCTSNTFRVGQTRYSMKDLGCSNKVIGIIKETGKSCGDKNAKILELGFSVEDEWFPIIFVCHIKTESISLFSKHVIQSKQLKGDKQDLTRPNFHVGGDFYRGFSPDDIYKKATNQRTLTTILNSERLAKKYLSSTYIARGHLAPDADFVLNAYQLLSYFYVNTAPQWQALNAGNWQSLEATVRSLAKNSAVDLQVITGTYDVLKLEDKDIYMFYESSQNFQLPVPKFFWKVVYNAAAKQGVAFVAVNNPFISNVSQSEILCPNICGQSGWGSKSADWERISHGYLYCCEVDDLKKVIPYIPQLRIKGILQGPI